MNSGYGIAMLLLLLCLVPADAGPAACAACCTIACATAAAAATGPMAVMTLPTCFGFCMATLGTTPLGVCVPVCVSPTP